MQNALTNLELPGIVVDVCNVDVFIDKCAMIGILL